MMLNILIKNPFTNIAATAKKLYTSFQQHRDKIVLHVAPFRQVLNLIDNYSISKNAHTR